MRSALKVYTVFSRNLTTMKGVTKENSSAGPTLRSRQCRSTANIGGLNEAKPIDGRSSKRRPKVEKPEEYGAKVATKREHIKLEYDVPAKVKKENSDRQIETGLNFGNLIVKSEAATEPPETDMMKVKQEPVDQSDAESTCKNIGINFGSLVVKSEGSAEPQETGEIKVKEEPIDQPEAGSSLKKNGYPAEWEAVLENLRFMRKDLNAPVDSMGCDQCMEDGANPKDKRFQALLSLMLSSQTKDQVTHAAMQRLIGHGCTLDNILKTTDQVLGELIYPVGFWKTKVKYIKRSSEMIRDEFGGDIPKTVKDLCKLNGVGPKMAHLCMKTAWGEITGIGVDTHVHRICNRIGWVKSNNPEGTRSQLEGWLPKELWSEVNHLLVGFGQQVCLPVKPQCGRCVNRDICPFVNGNKAKLKAVKQE